MSQDDLEANPRRPPPIVASVTEVRAHVAAARRRGERIGLVPTMGALHRGHLSLVESSASECDLTVVSIFVNPTQFAAGEDFEKYPRNLDDDCARAGAAGANLVFAPSVETMYPDGFQTFVEPGAVAARWEGAHRPDHFRGVATIVLKLLTIVAPDASYFGRKDYQQSVVVRRMVHDLELPGEIRVLPTVREDDGLALSSRNAYLSDVERRQALVLSASLRAAVDAFRSGQRTTPELLKCMQACFAAEPAVVVDYATVVDPQTLEPADEADATSVVLVAARVGSTRLIDNCVLGHGLP